MVLNEHKSETDGAEASEGVRRAREQNEAGGLAGSGDGGEGAEVLRERVEGAMKRVYDPEIPVDIFELGLIYKIDVDVETGKVKIVMTLTTPHCPEAQSLPLAVRQAAEEVEGVTDATVEITWDPPWDRDMMSDVARLQLGMF